MKSRLVLEQEIKQFNGPGFADQKVIAEILLDIRELLFYQDEGGVAVKPAVPSVEAQPQKTAANKKGPKQDEELI